MSVVHRGWAGEEQKVVVLSPMFFVVVVVVLCFQISMGDGEWHTLTLDVSFPCTTLCKQ
jgi:hypothetical protein